eukprot:9387428-Alexandrium_andersonii.AAC.1
MSFLKWSLRAAAAGIHPSKRHDGSDFQEPETHRLAAAGTPLKGKFVVIHMRGDWAEFCERYGYPAHSSSTRPCFICASSPDSLFKPLGLSLLSSPWKANTDRDYEAASERCELRVRVTADLHRKIRRALYYDKRQSGYRGRVLATPIPEAGLRPNDRLEATEDMWNVAHFDSFADFPRDVVFWRQEQATMTHHRSP